jgi:hypothetical protein
MRTGTGKTTQRWGVCGHEEKKTAQRTTFPLFDLQTSCQNEVHGEGPLRPHSVLLSARHVSEGEEDSLLINDRSVSI